MANKFLEGLQNTKARTLLIFGVLILLIVAIVIYFVTGKSTPLGTDASKTGKVPLITAIPGGVTSERYQELQEEENRRRAEAARKTGSSEVATIIGSRSKDALASKERFGIEDLLKKECVCPQGSGIAPERVAELLAEIEANPDKALELLRANPGLAKELCKQKPELALKVMEKVIEAAKLILNECPELAQALAVRNPELFKKLMLENPELARKIAAANPDLIKKLMLEDPDFARALAKSNPALVKQLMLDDPNFAKALAEKYPDLVKQLMLDDPEFAKALAAKNPDLVKKLMLDDPEFAKALAKNNPDLVKKLLLDDPEFARALAKSNPELLKQLMLNDPEFAKKFAAQYPDVVNQLIQDDPEFGKALQARSTLSDQDKLRAEEERLRKQRESQLTAEQLAQLSEIQQQQLQDLTNAMEGQAKEAFQAWNEFNPQQFVQGEWAKKEEQEKLAKEKALASGKVLGPDGKVIAKEQGALFKAGTILFATLDTTISSDEPGPILATITAGPYKGSKLLGTFVAAPQPGGLPPERVTLNFTSMNIPSAPRSISVQAVAIDPDTERTALQSSIDHHFLLRYGSILASSFLVGYAKVITSAGSVQTTSANGLSTTTTAAQLSGKKEIYAALGEVGKKLGDSWKQYADMPPTIMVDAGTCLGILFLADVTGP